MKLAEVSIQIKAVYEVKKILRDGWKIVHAPNEEARDARTVSKQMALGMHVGFPDLVVFSFQTWAIRANTPHSVCRSVGEALRVFESWDAIPRRLRNRPQL